MQTTFPRLLLQHATERPSAPAMREKEYGIWQALTWGQLADMVQAITCGLHQAGFRRDEHMVVIGANRPRLYATMLAVQSLGGVPIPLYQDAVAAECVFPINNAEVRYAFAEDQEQVDKLLEIRAQCPQLSPEQLDRFAASFACNGDAKRTALRQFRQIMQPGFFRDFAAMRERILIHVPCRVVWGDRDRFIPVGFAHAFGCKQVRIIPDGGHWLALTAPETLAAEIEAFSL